MTRVAVLVLAVAALLVGALAATARTPPADRGAGRVVLELSGSVDGLYPGGSAHLPIQVANPYPFPVTVLDLQVTVADAGLGCPAGVLELGTYAGGALVPGRGRATVRLPISMSVSTPDACQDASFPLTYQATATRSR